ncbi:MAG TPA: hypothetical protein PK648_08265 [Verrucomicrobiales bacterium]|nr:hypothetical protein [Verrucomicrobiales bacterium]
MSLRFFLVISGLLLLGVCAIYLSFSKRVQDFSALAIPEVVRLGNISAEQTIEIDLPVTNLSGGRFILKRITGSCACISVVSGMPFILESEHVNEVRLDVTAPKSLGEFSSHLILEIGDDKSHQEEIRRVSVLANSVVDLEISPQSWRIVPYPQSEKIRSQKRFQILSNNPKDMIRTVEILSKHRFFEFEVERVSPHEFAIVARYTGVRFTKIHEALRIKVITSSTTRETSVSMVGMF